jgi:signal transduction histidine kinase
MLGYDRDELLAMRLEQLHPPAAAPKAFEAFGRMMRGEATDSRLPCLRKDGSAFHANIRGTPMSFDGRDCLAGFFTDVTDRQLLEEERLRSAKLESIGVLAGGIAHDFNNLLQGIFGAISVAKRGLDPAAQPFAMLEQAEGALRQSVALATQLLTFSRGGTPVKRPLALRPLIEGAARLSLSGSRVLARMDFAEQLTAVEADEGQIAQVVQNIVLNAVQAMPGGGTLSIDARNVRAPGPGVPPQLEPGEYAAVRVRDSGAGIPAEHLPRIFDPWFTTKEKGSGLGLATSYSIVRNHGGALVARSEPGRGIEF